VPLYEYKCAKCGKRTEKIESVSGPHLRKCPHCGGKVERMAGYPAAYIRITLNFAGRRTSAVYTGSDGLF